MPPRIMERFLGLGFGLASCDEEATMGVAVVGVFLFLR